MHQMGANAADQPKKTIKYDLHSILLAQNRAIKSFFLRLNVAYKKGEGK